MISDDQDDFRETLSFHRDYRKSCNDQEAGHQVLDKAVRFTISSFLIVFDVHQRKVVWKIRINYYNVEVVQNGRSRFSQVEALYSGIFTVSSYNKFLISNENVILLASEGDLKKQRPYEVSCFC